MKLELKHLAPYLIHNINVIINNKLTVLRSIHCGEAVETTPIVHGYKYCALNHVKPILRPLSDLTKDNYYLYLSDNLRFNIDILGLPNYLDLKVNDYNILLENHFDVFGLIEKGLAIDINTLDANV